MSTFLCQVLHGATNRLEDVNAVYAQAGILKHEHVVWDQKQAETPCILPKTATICTFYTHTVAPARSLPYCMLFILFSVSVNFLLCCVSDHVRIRNYLQFQSTLNWTRLCRFKITADLMQQQDRRVQERCCPCSLPSL